LRTGHRTQVIAQLGLQRLHPLPGQFVLMVFGAPLFELAIQPRVAMVVAQAQQPMDGLFDYVLSRLGAATD
jgi:hypothetical protein